MSSPGRRSTSASSGRATSGSDASSSIGAPAARSTDGTAAGPTGGSGNWQRRWQPLLGQWVIVSASTAARPWSGAMARGTTEEKPRHDPDCYLCPRVVRANGTENPDYRGAFAFDNDFPSLSFDAPDPGEGKAPLARTAPAHGRCRVLCWSERHDATLASLSDGEMRAVVRLWRDEYRRLAAEPGIANVLLFENKGTEIGVSNLHPHGQIYATDFVTDTATRLRESQAAHARANGGASLLQDMLAGPPVRDDLVVERGERHSVIVPFAARFAYESWIVPHRSVGSVAEMDDAELDELAALYRRQVRRYDLVFHRSAPNVTLLHNVPCDDHPDNAHWSFHLAFHPPLRDPEKMKFLAGFESGAGNIVNPLQPEHAAERLRAIDVDDWPPW